MSKAAELANLIGNINAGGGGVNRNVLINGAMKVAQRLESDSDNVITGLGSNTTSTTTTRYKCCDRWGFEASSTDGRFSMSQDTSVPTGEGFANSLKLACTTADTSIAAGELLVLQQRVEGQNLQAFAKGTSDAKPFVLSFYAKANASKTYVAEIFDIDNSRHVGKTFTVGTDWTRHEITFPADTTGAFDNDNAESIRLNIWLHGGSTFTGGTLGTTWQAEDADDRAAGIGSFFDSTSNTFFITGVQLEVGQNPTEFEHEPFATTIHKCQRYYTRLTTYNTYAFLGVGYIHSSTAGTVMFRLPTRMRTDPSHGHSGTFRLVAPNADDLTSINAVYSNRISPTLEAVVSGGHGESSGNAMMIGGSNDADAFIEFTAEL